MSLHLSTKSPLRPAFAALAAVALALWPGAGAAQTLSAADAVDIARAEAHINALTTLKANFTQASPSGRTTRGTLWLSRPGKLRVDYLPPTKLRIMATGVMLIIDDCRSDPPQQYPLRSTPAGILTEPRIRLRDDFNVTAVRRGPGTLALRVVDPKARDRGTMILQFGTEPLRLTGWTVIDQNDAPTRVTLDSVDTGFPLDPEMFEWIRTCP